MQYTKISNYDNNIVYSTKSIDDYSYYTTSTNNIKKHKKFLLYSINYLSKIIGFNNAVKLVMQSILIEMLMYDSKYVYHYDISYWCNEIMKCPYIE